VLVCTSIGSLILQKVSATNAFHGCLHQFRKYKSLSSYRFISATIKNQAGNISEIHEATMNTTLSTPGSKSLVWAVLSKGSNGRSEVIKITTHDEADQYVMNNPEVYYKSGPVLCN